MYYVVTCTFLFILILAGAFNEDNCPQCIPSDNCPHFTNMNRRDQENWMDQFSCQYSTKDDSSYLHEFSSETKEYVCCPGFSSIEEQKFRSNFPFGPGYQSPFIATNYNRNDFGNNQRKNIRRINSNINNGKITQLPNIFNGLHPTTRRPPSSNPNYNIFPPGFNNAGIDSTPRPQIVYPVFTSNSKTVNIRPQVSNMMTNNTKVRNECQATILPPNPASFCCGVDTFGLEGTTDLQNVISMPIANLNRNNARFKRQIENDDTVEIHLDNRITGGLETELNQFPWTVLLRSTFDFGGNNITNFDCGGSIISSRYILTAAHCVTEDDATFIDVVIYLAEYDKRTFPRDCKVNPNGMTSCINNVLMNSEKVIPHAEFNSKSLRNDIALIRLRGSAPYTEFIRPICLPPFDIDNEAFHDLPLPVAGWGRNGPYVSNVKQSAVLNLVSRNICLQYYQYLQSSHLCAVGRTGEDTCKGDSGGPLMMVYGGIYYVVGIVSGKRSDFPCGTAVPSLFTNVFKYLQWINSNIK